MKILVTGGLGFIGHNVVSKLEQQGHECYIVDNTTDYGVLNPLELENLLIERASLIKKSVWDKLDIRDTRSLSKIFETFKPDCVLHLASFPRQKIVNKDPKSALDVMLAALVDLLFLSGRHNVERFVYVSSSMVYGDTHQVYSYVPENAVCKPKGQYAIFKYTGELLVKDWAERYKKSFIICRPSAVYGERDSTDRVVSKFISQAFKNQTLEVRGQREIMDFTHVDDCSEGIAAATLSSHNNLVFNITKSDTKLWTITDAAKIIVEQVGSGSINVVDRDPSFPSRSNLDIRLARKLLSYDPKISLSNGLVRYIDWYKEHLLYTD